MKFITQLNLKLKINQIIDLDRYPIDQPSSACIRELMEAGKKSLDESALFSLEGFIRPDVIAKMAVELEAALSASCRYDQPRTAYDYQEAGFPADHPKSIEHQCTYNQVLNYQISNDSPLRQVFYWQPLTDFLRELCGYITFYRSDCPHLALTSKIAGSGDIDGWHFDTNDVVFSILLQAPDSGGEFEYAPYVRSEQSENYDGVAAVIADPSTHAIRPDMGVGNLTVFKGDLSLHRVTPVVGNRKRIVALFSYDRNSGTTFSQSYINQLNSCLPG